MSGALQDERKVRRFVETAFTDDKTAKKYLKRNKWIVEHALDDYYNTGGEEGRCASQQVLADRAQIFQKFADPNGATPTCTKMDEEGVERLCEALGIEPVDPRILVLCFLCGASTMGTFSRAEFMEGLSALNVSSLAQLQEKPEEWQQTLESPEAARPVYRFLYKYALEHNCKSLPTEVARDYWMLILPPLKFELCPQWLQFVDEVLMKRENSQVSKDVWNVVFDFLKLTCVSDVEAFDSINSAWPTVIDEFVEWCRNESTNSPEAS